MCGKLFSLHTKPWSLRVIAHERLPFHPTGKVVVFHSHHFFRGKLAVKLRGVYHLESRWPNSDVIYVLVLLCGPLLSRLLGGENHLLSQRCMFSGLRCPIEHRLVYELCKASSMVTLSVSGKFRPNHWVFSKVKSTTGYLQWSKNLLICCFLGMNSYPVIWGLIMA